MFSRNALPPRYLAVLVAAGAVIIASCGENSDFGLGQRFPVSGTVTYNNKPLEKGQIIFTPADATPGAVGSSGTIENGSYTMSTVGDRDGARAGKYKVTIVAKEDSEAQAQAEFEKARAKLSGGGKDMGGGGGRIPREFMVKATKEAKSLIPAGYGDLRTTTLTAEVKAEPNKIDFTLTDADAPPEPPKDADAGKGRRKKR